MDMTLDNVRNGYILCTLGDLNGWMEDRTRLLRMFDVGVKLVSGIKSMHDDSSSGVTVKWGESERFRIDSGVIHGCIM